ncbi:MAG TPA: LysM peptidoglycan-binding domain-containing protein [Flavobacterium sp.]|nr:LysM peptidoglycan-binding domain-containing protein [Flavobacterium sp.]
MKKIVFTLLFMFGVSSIYAQVTYKTHTVEQGESLTHIAQKYYTTIDDIRQLNPGVSTELSANQQLKVPNRDGAKLHEVQPKETLYAISKQYKVTINQLNDWNPVLLTDGLQPGQTIVVSPANVITAKSDDTNEIRKYKVQKGDTIYSIAVRHKVAVSEIYEVNPGLADRKIKEGDEIVMPQKALVLTNNPTQEEEKKNTETPQQNKIVEVQPQQTIYSISKENNISIEELVRLNPEIKNGLQPGMKLRLSADAEEIIPIKQEEKEESTVVLEQKNQIKNSIAAKTRKEVVFLLPFNNNQESLDGNKSALDSKLQKDVFLNMTLDFYSGVLLALDSVQKMNYPMQVKIIDSKESNRSMKVSELLWENDFSQTDVIIGPFFQSNVDALSEALKNQPTYIVSPLSTDEGKGFINQVHAMPTTNLLRKGMMDYMISKGKNIVYLTHQQQNIDFGNSSGTTLTINQKGDNISAQQLKDVLKKYSGNYVVLDSESLEAAINITNILHKLRQEYDVQLALLDRSSILDTSEISVQTLADLKTIFPSVTADFDNYKYTAFHDKFYQKYKRSPNRFATRGFDITMDVLQRLYQTNESDAGVFDENSEQIENAFEYQNLENGIYNKGIYILYFDTDLSIRNAF